MKRMPVLAPLATVILLGSSSAYAQLPTPPVALPASPTLVNGVLSINGTTLQPDDSASREELPGIGHKFELFGVMVQDTDPENATGNSGHSGGGGGGNEGISATMTPTSYALAYRSLTPGIGIKALTNQIGFKYYFQNRTCGAGSPRVTLLIDSDGDGDTDFAAHGHVNPAGNYGACVPNTWVYEDLTDNLLRWEVTPGGAVPGVPTYPYMPWKQFAAAVSAAFPFHKVSAGFLVEDSCSFAPQTCGKAYYDLFTLENRTLEIWQDAVKKQQ